MVFKEIWAPEALIVFFLALPLLRPLIKALWSLDGLVWLPLIALGITIGIFPAYGFRPECIPMLVFVLICNIANISPFIVTIASRPSDSFRDRGPVLTIFALIVLGAAAAPMFVFSPKLSTGPKVAAESVQSVTIYNIQGPAKAFSQEYSLRLYGDVQQNQPIIFLIPPEIGSAASVDMVCSGLQKKGYTVVTYSRKGYDPVWIDENNRKNLASLNKFLTYWKVFARASSFASANEQGKALEAERRVDIEFLLSRLFASPGGATNRELPPTLLVGYGAGGSALAYLLDDEDFALHYSNVLGAVAIESRLWSSYLPEPVKIPVIPPAAGIVQRYWAGIVNYFIALQPQRVSRTGPLPGAATIPMLYLVSGKALDTPAGQKPYEAVVNSLRTSSGPVALAAIESAGPLDYQDFPLTHPLCSFLLPGRENAKKSENPIDDTVGIIGNYAALLLGEEENKAPYQPIQGSLYVESKGLPGFKL